MQDAETQTFRRLSTITVRKSLKIWKNFQKSSTIQIGLVTQKVSQGILETQKFTNQKKKAIGANGHKESRNQK
jgi:hypothetical protein